MKYIKSFEGLNLSGTYLSRREENTKKALEEIRKMIVEIADKLKIDLPVKEWSEDFIKIKKELSKEVDRNTDISFLLFSHLSFHEQKTFLVNAMLKYASNASSEKNSPQKIVIGHLDFKKVPNVERDPVENETYQVIFPDNIKKLIQDSPDANKLDTYVYIKCETGKWNRIHFPGRVDRLYRFANLISGVDEAPQLFKGGKHGKNAFDLLNGIPTSVRGIGLGQAIYSEFIKFKGYASSSSRSSRESQSVWKKLANDPHFMGISMNYRSGEGDILLFSKDFKGDIDKVVHDYLINSQERFYEEQELHSIKVDPELRAKLKFWFSRYKNFLK